MIKTAIDARAARSFIKILIDKVIMVKFNFLKIRLNLLSYWGSKVISRIFQACPDEFGMNFLCFGIRKSKQTFPIPMLS